MTDKPKFDYKAAGVDIDAGNTAVERIKASVHSTYSSAVLSELGGFGGFYDFKALGEEYVHPVLAQSIDGVGTKIIIARLMQKYDTIGQDLVSACCNDIIVAGAKPLTFLDYIANDSLNPDVVAAIVSGIAEACRECAVALIGGETAEMPDTYLPGENDLVGIVTGIVEKSKIITGRAIQPGDKIIGIASSGLHTNGYSLARKLFFDVGNYTVKSYLPELGCTVGEALLEPHINYTTPVLELLSRGVTVNGMAHITGGGFTDNLPRVLPGDCAIEIDTGAWEIPPLFTLMQNLGNLDDGDMYRTFNMGIGLAIFIPAAAADVTLATIKTIFGPAAFTVGNVIVGDKKVIFK